MSLRSERERERERERGRSERERGVTCTMAWWAWAGCHWDGDGVSMEGERVAAVKLPVTTAWYPRSGGSIGEENGAQQTSYRVPPAPTTLYTQVIGAHQPDKVGRPRSGHVRGENGSSRWTRSLNVGDHPNNICFTNLKHLIFINRGSSIYSKCIDFGSYHLFRVKYI
jgi:hypothetical protein